MPPPNTDTRTAQEKRANTRARNKAKEVEEAYRLEQETSGQPTLACSQTTHLTLYPQAVILLSARHCRMPVHAGILEYIM